jgi:hypothetical protein
MKILELINTLLNIYVEEGNEPVFRYNGIGSKIPVNDVIVLEREDSEDNKKDEQIVIV